MTFTLSILLFAYFLFLFLWFVFSLVAVYHMVRFGYLSFFTYLVTFIYIAVSILLLFASYNFISQIDWGMNVTLFAGIADNWFGF